MVEIKSGKDINVIGSQVVGSSDVTLNAGENINIAAGEESYQSSNHSETVESGFLDSGGGIGFSYGTDTQTNDNNMTENSYANTAIGSTGGSVHISSGKDTSISGSDILTKNDIDIAGENVSIIANDAVTESEQKSRHEKTGLTVFLTGTATDVYNAVDAVNKTSEKGNDTQTALQALKMELTLMQSAMDVDLKTKDGMTQASAGVSAMLGTQVTEQTSKQTEHQVVSSGISAGRNLTITARGDGSKESGDITIKGSGISAGNDMTLDANRDVNILAAANTTKSTSDETSYSVAVGIQAQAGGDENGLNGKVTASLSGSSEDADSTIWSNSSVQAGNGLKIKSGRDTNIRGGQLKGESVKMEVGNDLNIESLQDSNSYDSKSGSASLSGTGGATGVSASVSLSSTKMKSRFASVNEQSGISAGSGGYDITVGNNTDLKGAVIASTATDTANNNLDTGTISFSEVKNSGYYDVDSISISASVSTNSLTPNAPSAYHNGDKQNSTTQSAIANGNLTVRNKDAQKQDVDTLSHDTENANTKLKAFFDKDKEQDRMDTVQMVKDVTVQVKTVGTKIDRLNAQKEVDKNGISKTAYDAAKDTLGANATEKQVKALEYSDAVDKAVIDATKDGNNIAGIGSGFNKVVDAGASLVTGAITGDVLGGIAGASAPYLATAIKNATGHQNPESGKWEMDDDDKAANYVFHGMLGAGVAALQGNSVLAGAVGAAGGEFAANTIRDNFYDGKDTKDLTESEKQNISNWSQIASGAAAFAGSGGNMGYAGTAMAASKNSVENNELSPDSGSQLIGLNPQTGSNMFYIVNAAANGYLTEDEAYQALQGLVKGKDMQDPVREDLKNTAVALVMMTPYGSYVAFREAETWGDYAIAAASLIPEGMVVSKFIKVGSKVYKAESKVAQNLVTNAGNVTEGNRLMNQAINQSIQTETTIVKDSLSTNSVSTKEAGNLLSTVKNKNDVSALTPTGSKGNVLGVPDELNKPSLIGDRQFSGHALDRMQRQGITPTAVENTINPQNAVKGKIPGTTAYHDKINNLTVITDTKSGRIITVDFGIIKQ